MKRSGESLEGQNALAEIRLRCDRKAGELLGEMPRASTTDNLKRGPKSHDETSGPALADHGLTKTQSHRYQQIAKLPEPDFEDYITTTREAGREITTTKTKRPRQHEADGDASGG